MGGGQPVTALRLLTGHHCLMYCASEVPREMIRGAFFVQVITWKSRRAEYRALSGCDFCHRVLG